MDNIVFYPTTATNIATVQTVNIKPAAHVIAETYMTGLDGWGTTYTTIWGANNDGGDDDTCEYSQSQKRNESNF
jgi:hypothetical protein